MKSFALICCCFTAHGTRLLGDGETPPPSLTSSNPALQEGFAWAVGKIPGYVQTGKTGLVNKDENHPQGTGTAAYIPSYWAGYHHRTAFYGRDFAHQATGAQIAGLREENLSMLKTFAKSATAGRKWFALWSFNFDGTPHHIDYRGDNDFVREIPAQFELVEKAHHLYRWTGDESYITDPDLLRFYGKTMGEFIEMHDKILPNGIPEGHGDIWKGSSTYNEHGAHPMEAGDGIGAQYQATLAYSGILKAAGETGKADAFAAKAKQLHRYFNQEWSVISPDKPDATFACMNTRDGRKLDFFNKETSWFMPMKLLTEPGKRTDAYLDLISENVGTGLGSTPQASRNIEAYTYLPEVYFPYHRNERGWFWMNYILSVRDKPHLQARQGSNGDYPEVSFTFLSHTVEGLMGVEPSAPDHAVTTIARLPESISWVSLKSLAMGAHQLDLRHDGLGKSTLTNTSGHPLLWEARFAGRHRFISAAGETLPALQKTINGVPISYIRIEIPPNETIVAEARD